MAKSPVAIISRKASTMFRKRGNRKSWQQCIDIASKDYKRGKKKKTRQTGTSVKKKDVQRKAKAPGKRKSRSGNTYYERRKNHSDKPGALTGLTASQLQSELVRRIKTNRDKAVVSKYNADKKSIKNKWQKRISSYNSQLKKFS